MPENTNPSAVSRRTVAKGIAWTVPVVVAAGAVPAFATSPGPIEISGIGASCKHPGQGASNSYPKAYHIRFVFRNTSTESVTFTLPGLVALPGGPGSSQVNCLDFDPVRPGQPLTVTVPANSTAYQVVVHYYSENSASGLITFSYTWVGNTSNTPGGDTFSDNINGGVCAPLGISNDHSCGGGSGTVADPVCIPTPVGDCPVPAP